MSIYTHRALAVDNETDDGVMRVKDTVGGGTEIFFPCNEGSGSFIDLVTGATIATPTWTDPQAPTKYFVEAAPSTGDISGTYPAGNSFMAFLAGRAQVVAQVLTILFGNSTGHKIQLVNGSAINVTGATGTLALNISGVTALNTTSSDVFLALVGDAESDVAQFYYSVAGGAIVQSVSGSLSEAGAITMPNEIGLGGAATAPALFGFGIHTFVNGVPSDITTILGELNDNISRTGSRKLPTRLLSI